MIHPTHVIIDDDYPSIHGVTLDEQEDIDALDGVVSDLRVLTVTGYERFAISRVTLRADWCN